MKKGDFKFGAGEITKATTRFGHSGFSSKRKIRFRNARRSNE